VARLKRLSGATVAQMANELGLQVEGEHPQVIARACRKSVSLRRVVDATLSIKDPLPEWALNNVILAPDLCQHVLRMGMRRKWFKLRWAEVTHSPAPLVCKAWSRSWKLVVSSDAVLHPVRSPKLDFTIDSARGLAVWNQHTDAGLLCVANTGRDEIRVLDIDETGAMRTVGLFGNGAGFGTPPKWAGPCGIAVHGDIMYTSERIGRLRKINLDDAILSYNANDSLEEILELEFRFTSAVEFTGGSYGELAIAPEADSDDGKVFVVIEAFPDSGFYVEARSMLTFNHLFDIRTHETWGPAGGLAVVGDELYVGMVEWDAMRMIVFSTLDGERQRYCSTGTWRMAAVVRPIDGCLWVIEREETCEPDEDLVGGRAFEFDGCCREEASSGDDSDENDEPDEIVDDGEPMAGRRIIVVDPYNPHGGPSSKDVQVLVYSCSHTKLQSTSWLQICKFDGKVIVSGEDGLTFLQKG